MPAARIIALIVIQTLAFGAQGDNLTRTEAALRKSLIDQVRYQVQIRLKANADTFAGKANITFHRLPTPSTQPLRLDFYRGKILSLKLNGQKLPATAKKKFWIDLPAKAIQPGTNTVEVEYTQSLARDGRGIHKFVDPETNEVFLHSHFESFDANRFIPCFDQPDLRAKITLQVEAPAHWQVISTTRESSIEENGKEFKTWTFPESQPISTYLFSLHAGPFKVWSDQAGDVPLRLFARPAMAAHVPVENWFRWTKSGFKFFNAYFAYPYPFKKYDQVIVPEIDGAMENVGAVTFSETYLKRSKPTRREEALLVETLLHEMAHMWFGNLVTMKWWNDLWLNESFASFMSALAMEKATEFSEAWEDFLSEFKIWAYYEDGLMTTHPIATPIENVRESYAIFDGITYGKGAGTLKQLWAYVTPEKFQKGLQDFISQYAFQNASREDLFATLQKQTNHPLTTWSKIWFEHSGTDRIQASWKCEEGRLKRISLSRRQQDQKIIRPHVLKVALYTSIQAQPAVTTVYFEKPTAEINGNWPCPVFVYPNHADEAFVRVELDAVSLELAMKSLAQFPDALLRLQLWGDTFQNVHEQIPMPGNYHDPRKYLDVVIAQLPHEQDEIILKQIVSSLGSAFYYIPLSDKKARMDRQIPLENQFLTRFQAAQGDTQKFWFDSYVGLAKSPEALAQIAEWATHPPRAAFPLDLDRRWTLARQLMRFQHSKGGELVTQLREEDRSKRGKVAAAEADAIQPRLDVKSRWIKRIQAPRPSLSTLEAENVLSALFPVEQSSLAQRLSGEFYSYLQRNARTEDEDLLKAMVRYQAPLDCGTNAWNKFKMFTTKTATGFSPMVKKEIENRLEEDLRCQRARASVHSL